MLVTNPAMSATAAHDGVRWVADHGVFATSSADAEQDVAMNVTYAAGAVAVQITNSGGNANSGASIVMAVTKVGTSSFSVGHEYLGPGGNVGGEIHWRSLGTVSL